MFRWSGSALDIQRTKHGYMDTVKLHVETFKCIKKNHECGDDLWICWVYLFIYNIVLSSLYFEDVCGYVLYLGWTMDWNFLSGCDVSLCTYYIVSRLDKDFVFAFFFVESHNVSFFASLMYRIIFCKRVKTPHKCSNILIINTLLIKKIDKLLIYLNLNII